MIIRLADLPDDALAIIDGARDFVSRLDYDAFLPETEDGLTDAIGRVVTRPEVEIALAEADGRIVGGLGMAYAPHLWNPERIAAEELFWWTAPDAPPVTALRLLKFVRRRAQARDAILMFKRLTSSPAGVDRVYRAMGLRPVEVTYAEAP